MCGYQLLCYPRVAEPCWVTSKLDEGPCITIGPCKGWPFNSCIVNESGSQPEVLSGENSNKERMWKGLFPYDLTPCKTKVLQPFDPNKSNFTKVGQEEVPFRFEESDEAKDPMLDKPNVIAINVSPIDYGHVLLDRLPQSIDHDSFLLALHMVVEARNASFRLRYNSLGAFVTINHLRFQAYYIDLPFPVERTPTKRVPWKFEKTGVKIFELCDYFISLFPKCYVERQALGEVSQEILDTQINPIVWGISGQMVLRKQDYEMAFDGYAWKLLVEVSLSKRFEVLKAYILEAKVEEEKPPIYEQEEDANIMEDVIRSYEPLKNSQTTSTHVNEGCLVLQMPCAPVMQLFFVYFKALVATTMYLLHIANSIGLEVEHVDERNMCCSTTPDCECKAQASKVCVASFDWTYSGICKFVEMLKASATKVVVGVLGDLADTFGANYVRRNLQCQRRGEGRS
eukprot:Gb_22583 [translate_table: standard]